MPLFDFESFGFALNNLTHQRLRSNLTILGIIIGVAAVVALFSLGEGLNASVKSYIDTLGSNTIFIEPYGDFMTMAFNRIKESDIQKIESISGIKSVIPFYESAGTIKRGEKQASGFFIGIDPQKIGFLTESGYMALSTGRVLQNSDHYSMLVSENFLTDAFDETIGMNQSFEVKGKKFKIVGVLKNSNIASSGFGQYNMVWVPQDVVKELFDEQNPTEAIAVLNDGVDQKFIAEKIEAKLEKSKKEKTVQVLTSESIAQQAGSMIGVVQIVLVGIAFIALIVGALGIMNTMVMSVIERTSEIGLMKAVGATDWKVREIFLIESALIGLLGGIVGIIFGYGAAFGISALAFRVGFPLPIELNFGIIFGAIAFSLLIGIVSGIVPANMAAKLDPVEALKFNE